MYPGNNLKLMLCSQRGAKGYTINKKNNFSKCSQSNANTNQSLCSLKFSNDNNTKGNNHHTLTSKDQWHQKKFLFTNNNENLISSIIKEKIKTVSHNDEGKYKDSSINESILSNDKNLITTNNQKDKQSVYVFKKQSPNFVSLNQNFVDSLNVEIEKYKIREQSASSIIKSNKKTAFNHNSNQVNRPCSSGFFPTTIPLFSFNSLHRTNPQAETNLIKYQMNKFPIKKFPIKKIPYIIKCMNKRRKCDEVDRNNINVYFQEVLNSKYANRYKKAHANVEEILLFHNTFERTSFGKYDIPSTIKGKLQYNKPRFEDYDVDKEGKSFGVKWDSIRISKM